MTTPFKDIYFGKASAEEDYTRDPQKFKQTYLDAWNIYEHFKQGDFFLITGPKGSGKTAAAYYCQTSWEDEYGENLCFSRHLSMEDIETNSSSLSRLDTKLVGPETQNITIQAWRLFITLHLTRLVIGDNSNPLSTDPQFLHYWKELETLGLTPSSDKPLEFSKLLRTVREKRVGIKKVFDVSASSMTTDKINITQVADILMKACLTTASTNHYLLSIDGLDLQISKDNSAYWNTLQRLIIAAQKIHTEIKASHSGIRLLIMCRNDLLKRINLQDLDKILGDHTLDIDWRADQAKADECLLWDYIAKKSEIRTQDFFNHFLIDDRSDTQRLDPLKYILECTRFTPREISILLTKIQEITQRTSPSMKEIKGGAKQFAKHPFLATVKAEIEVGLPDIESNTLLSALSQLNSAKRITKQELHEVLAYRIDKLDTRVENNIIDFLFEAGLIGNLNDRTGYVQFFHRMQTYDINPHGPWKMQRGLALALSLSYTS